MALRELRHLIAAHVLFLTYWLGFAEISHAQAAQTAPRALTTPQILEKEGPAVVMVEVRNAAGGITGQASGVVIRQDGSIITNLHVLEGACDVRVRFATTQEPIPVHSVVRADKDQDLVLIRVSEGRLPIATIGSSKRLQVGERVVAIGNPMGLERSVSEGIIAGIRMEDANTWIQVTTPISSGSSGGGLYSSSGELVGITTFSLRESQNLNFAVPIERATAMLSASEIPWATASKIFCNREPPALDSRYILKILGRWDFDPTVVEVLRTLNEGAEPEPKPRDELSFYVFPRIGVIVTFEEGLAAGVQFDRKFHGVLPFDLSWAQHRDAVRRLLGSPVRTVSVQKSNPLVRLGDCVAWEEYHTENRVYGLCYAESGQLVGIGVTLLR